MPVPEGNQKLAFLDPSQGLGWLSALSRLFYFAIAPYVNIVLFGNKVLPSLVLPAIGMLLMGLVIAIPRVFPLLSVLFAVYTLFILAVTA